MKTMKKKPQIIMTADKINASPEGITIGNAPPDTDSYTGCYPYDTTASYIYFDPISTAIGGPQPFTFYLYFSLNLDDFATKTPQNILQISQEGNTVYSVDIIALCPYMVIQTTFATTHTTQMMVNEVDSPGLDTWYYYAATWDGSTWTVYCNDYLNNSTATQLLIQKPVFQIGLNTPNTPDQAQAAFNGFVHSFFVWNTCLSQIEIQRQSFSPSTTPVSPHSLVLGYDMTVNPPNQLVPSGPNIHIINTSYVNSTHAMRSYGWDVATPGQGTQINPGGAASFSILAWIYVGVGGLGDNPGSGYIFSNGDINEDSHFGLKLVNGNLVAEFGSQTITSSTSMQNYVWYYIALSFDQSSSTCTLYINNENVGSGSLTTPSSPASAAISLFGILDSGTPTGLFLGYIQFLSVWKTALSSSQITMKAFKDPTLEPNCVANFNCAIEPYQDSLAVQNSDIWGTDQIQMGSGINPDVITVVSPSSIASTSGKRCGNRITILKKPSRLEMMDLLRSITPAPVVPFTAAHRQLMINELKSALSSMPKSNAQTQLLENYVANVNEIFDIAQSNPEQIHNPITYEKIGNVFRLFYHPETGVKIDLDIEVDMSNECALWWTTFFLTALLGLLEIYGIATPVDKLKTIALQIVTNPAVIEICNTMTTYVFTTGILLSICGILYEQGYLSQVLWFAASKIGWWGAGKLILYVVGILAPTATPQKALFIANAVKLVAALTLQLTQYTTACSSGGI